jgi:hypothetical protein
LNFGFPAVYVENAVLKFVAPPVDALVVSCSIAEVWPG